MATAQITVILVAVVFLTAFYDGGGGGVWALSQAPAQSSTDCFTEILNMTDCLTFVGKGSKLTVPDKPCCPELAGLVESNPVCLCQLLANSSSFGVEIDVNMAIKLPSVCHVDAPPPSTCKLFGIPVDVPPSSEPPTPTSPGVPPPGRPAGPPPSGATDNGVSSWWTFIVGLAIAFIPSFF